MPYDPFAGEAARSLLANPAPDSPALNPAELLQSVQVHAGLRCEDCGSTDVEDNQRRGPELTYRCVGCGHQWSPNL